MDKVQVPEIWYKAQRVLRTGLQALAAALTLWGAIAVAAPGVLTELAKILPGSWVAWLTGAVATVTLVAGVLSAIMANPKVNDLLTKIGLGSVPKSALVPVVPQGDPAAIAKVRPDPNVLPVPVLPGESREEYRRRTGVS